MYLQETNLKILELLKRFKYLSSSQLIKLGVASSQPATSRILQRFFKNKDEVIKSPLINKLTFQPHPTRGKLENLYCLNKRGALFLSEYLDKDLSEIEYVKGSGFFAKDYFHRVTQIDYHINLYLQSQKEGFTIDFFYNYFDKTGSNNSNSNQRLEAKTKIVYEDGSFFIPDGIYKITKTISDGTKQQFYYILEIHKGNDTKRAIETIEKNIKALVDGCIAKKHNYKYSHRVVMIFDSETIKISVLKRLNNIKKFTEFKDYFLLYKMSIQV